VRLWYNPGQTEATPLHHYEKGQRNHNGCVYQAHTQHGRDLDLEGGVTNIGEASDDLTI
jgi:hypothetical protein